MTERSSSSDSNNFSELESGQVSSQGLRGDLGDCHRCDSKGTSTVPVRLCVFSRPGRRPGTEGRSRSTEVEGALARCHR